MSALFQNYPAKTKQEISRLPGDVRYLRKDIFCAVLNIFCANSEKIPPHGPSVLFDHIKEVRQVFGMNERVVDLVALVDVIKHYSESHRRSFDLSNSKEKHSIAFWNLSSSQVPTPKTDFPVYSPKAGERVTSKGAIRLHKYGHLENDFVVGVETAARTDSVAKLIGTDEYADRAVESKGKGVFGFFEKGILQLEPGNDPAQKVMPSPKIVHEVSAGMDRKSKFHDNQHDIRDEGYRGTGIQQVMNYVESPRKASARPTSAKVSVADLIQGGMSHSEKFDEPVKRDNRKVNHHYFDTPIASPRSKPTISATGGNSCRKAAEFQQWSMKGQGVCDALSHASY